MKRPMRRRDFLALALLSAGAMISVDVTRQRRTQAWLKFLDRQITPAAAAASATQKAQTEGTGKLGKGDIFWSVMWPYMHTVGRAEGTVGNAFGISPYQVIYTYDQFDDFSDHPRRAHPILDRDGRPTGKVSDAAGWPQFISTTWDQLMQENDFWYDGPTFQPANQDLGFLYLHRDTGGHAALMAGVQVEELTQRLTVTYDAFTRAISCDSHQWASLPGANIGEATGQHTRPLWWLWSEFQWALWGQMGYRRKIVHPLGTKTKIIAPMGYQAWRGATHWGQDFESAMGGPIVAPEAGVVTRSDYDPKDGYSLSFRPAAQPELSLIFQHCQSSSVVALNTRVEAGTLIGRTGDSGQSITGPHVHIEVTVDGHHINPHYYLGMSQWF
ncbi:MAG: M23 family metallopeptidase [Cyanobacteria bacterium P01_F01_bin.53]